MHSCIYRWHRFCPFRRTGYFYLYKYLTRIIGLQHKSVKLSEEWMGWKTVISKENAAFYLSSLCFFWTHYLHAHPSNVLYTAVILSLQPSTKRKWNEMQRHKEVTTAPLKEVLEKCSRGLGLNDCQQAPSPVFLYYFSTTDAWTLSTHSWGCILCPGKCANQ